METVVVERTFAEPVDYETIQAVEDEHAWCLEKYRITYVQTFFSSDRKRMICVYEAPDAEAVRAANRVAGMPFERIYTASVHGPPDRR